MDGRARHKVDYPVGLRKFSQAAVEVKHGEPAKYHGHLFDSKYTVVLSSEGAQKPPLSSPTCHTLTKPEIGGKASIVGSFLCHPSFHTIEETLLPFPKVAQWIRSRSLSPTRITKYQNLTQRPSHPLDITHDPCFKY